MKIGRKNIHYFESGEDFLVEEFGMILHQMVQEVAREKQKEGVVFLCIGTDRSTGDSLGPLIGYKLKDQMISGVRVLGTLDCPVHALNLEQSILLLKLRYPNHVIVAIDASVGSFHHIGCITVGKGSLRPGLGVRKELQEVGDMFITGIVGGYGNRDPLMLQSVRLSTVMQMADCICESIIFVERFWQNAYSF